MNSPEPAESAPRTVVAVLYGGQNSEHSISCLSAGAVMSHLDSRRYEVIPVGITTDGRWVAGTTNPDALASHNGTLPQVTMSRGVTLIPGTTQSGRGQLRFGDGSLYAEIDVAFPVLHGVNGEDGTIQGILQLANVPYVGNGVFASAACMDKQYTKLIARAAGIPVGDEIVLKEPRDLSSEEQEQLGLPVFVKPARGGSSVGISKVANWDDLPEALELAFSHDNKILIEAMLHGVEVECGVLQYPDGSVVASQPALLKGTEDGPEGFYGFATKYLDDIISYEIPAPFAEGQIDAVRQWAVATFRALDCEGLARIDFFVTDDGPVLNEPNTMPGFTPISMYPKMFEASGLEYAELLDILLSQALASSRSSSSSMQ